MNTAEDKVAAVLDSPDLTRRLLLELSERISDGDVENGVVAALMSAHGSVIERVSVANQLHGSGSGIKPATARRSRRPARPNQ